MSLNEKIKTDIKSDVFVKIIPMTSDGEEFMQETQHTQQRAIRTAQNQDKKRHECKWLQKHRRHTETNKHLFRERWENRLGTVSDKCHWGA